MTSFGTPIRIGLIGTSGWSEFMYLTALHDDPRVELVALAGRDAGKLDALANKWNIPNRFTDAHALIASDLDAVIVASPDSSHAEYAIAALNASKHVLCEKPLAMTTGQTQRMLEAAEKSGHTNMVMFTFRFLPFIQQLRKEVAELGQITDARFEFRQGYARNSEYIWRLDPSHATGVIGDLGSHLFDLAYWILGDFEIASAASNNLFHPNLDTNEKFTALAKLATGGALTFVASMIDEMGDTDMEQLFEFQSATQKLSVRAIYSGPRAGIHIERRKSGESSFVSDLGLQAPHYPAGPRSFVSAILGETQQVPAFADGHRTQQHIARALELAAQ
ncbi:MAG: Gfo/Idh/MocA family protein [Microbacteriaceae bacterium]